MFNIAMHVHVYKSEKLWWFYRDKNESGVYCVNRAIHHASPCNHLLQALLTTLSLVYIVFPILGQVSVYMSVFVLVILIESRQLLIWINPPHNVGLQIRIQMTTIYITHWSGFNSVGMLCKQGLWLAMFVYKYNVYRFTEHWYIVYHLNSHRITYSQNRNLTLCGWTRKWISLPDLHRTTHSTVPHRLWTPCLSSMSWKAVDNSKWWMPDMSRTQHA